MKLPYPSKPLIRLSKTKPSTLKNFKTFYKILKAYQLPVKTKKISFPIKLKSISLILERMTIAPKIVK
jgi:hypothetical protein